MPRKRRVSDRIDGLSAGGDDLIEAPGTARQQRCKRSTTRSRQGCRGKLVGFTFHYSSRLLA
jgi:hypothetical protein